ncbi:protease pro-enzyme activation domain-containing protein [Acidianus ambivalens]|uniref:S8 family serine peptidase n=1 Tax=Acidianus ambivalens TaxID=2283 RepID=A0A650CU06_ACIAM|nr:protease pro-enzyme activation domain-containing protein [Acidianus ambivalens]MQL56102.1 S8 family serine peptidase [Acidianus ambivalens]QGR21351.1 S8 family serine peptidase [Acidianus ambivalens]
MRSKSIIILSLLIFATIQFLPITHSQPTAPPGFKFAGNLQPNKEVLFTVYIPLKCTCKIFYYAEETSNPSSPLYHHFLTKTQIQQFLPTEKYEEVLNQLKADGFKIILTTLDSVIVAEGTVSQIHQYLGLNFAVYTNGTLTFYESYGTPTIPGVAIVSQNLTADLFAHPQFLITQKDIQSLASRIADQANITVPIEAYWPTALQKVYNATALYAMNDYGQGYNIGILDFCGDPYIFQQLAYFDKVTGLPPTNFTVIPIGPYDPSKGIITGWAGEISLDVEVAHSMAPKANITLYIANGALPLSAVIACIVNQDIVDDLSQSFGISESIFSLFNAQEFYTCVYETDVYYALGSAEGITFLAASGDGGGSGYSNGPIGSVIYPSSSPFVTSVGGTTTYIQFPGNSTQTAWSNYGFVPDDVNFGGSTGGVSVIEPKPYYEWGIPTPSTYPAGKTTPAISANANVYPGVYIIFPGNVTGITGGTSEASPLTAGLLALVMNYAHTKLGNLNPVIYMFGENSTIYSKVFNPITFGYNIPWTATYGYNLVTGFGTLNLGEFAYYYNMTMKKGKELSIEVAVFNSTGLVPPQFFPGQTVEIVANITYNGTEVTSGSFTAVISNILGNISTVPLAYNPSANLWIGTTTLPSNANGILEVTAYGSSNGVKGYGVDEVFSGYFVQFLLPETFVPVLACECFIVANVTDALGQLYNCSTLLISIYKYCILNNSYTLVGNTTLMETEIKPNIVAWVGKYPSLTPGDYLMMVGNAFGYVAFTNGVSLQGEYPFGLFILPPVIEEPGSVYPGENIIIQGIIQPPSILATVTSSSLGIPEYCAVLHGSNVTAELVNPEGKVVSTAKIFLNCQGIYFGELHVPSDVTPGLYTILLHSSYFSLSLGQYINGSFYGQIYVQEPSTVNVKVQSYSFEGQTLTVYANITYPNGTEVKYGMYSATVYPQSLCFEYSQISIMVELPLWYNAKLGLWVGNVTLPSTLYPGNLTYLAGLNYYGAPFRILITGETYNGYSTSPSPTLAGITYVLPYTAIEGKTVDGFQTYNSALINDTIITNGTLTNDVLINDTIIGHVTIVGSNLTNVKFLNSSITLISSSGSNLHLDDSNITLVDSSVDGITLVNSMITIENSKISNISPALPEIKIISPTANQNLTGVYTISFNIIGQDISKVLVLLNGQEITEFSGNGTFSYALNTTKYPDGSYAIEVEAIQADGLYAKSSVTVNFENQLENLYANVKANETSLSSSINNLDNSLTSVKTSLSTLIYITLGLAVIAIIIGIVAIIMSRRRK